MWKTHIKEDVESADSPAGQILATHPTSEFSVLTPESTEELVCHAFYLEVRYARYADH